jgi:hypothetical protein
MLIAEVLYNLSVYFWGRPSILFYRLFLLLPIHTGKLIGKNKTISDIKFCAHPIVTLKGESLCKKFTGCFHLCWP